MLRPSLAICLGLGLLSFLVVPAQATTCLKSDNCWDSVTTLTVWTGQPTVICPIGHPVARIESAAQCNDNRFAGPAVTLMCGVTSFSFSYSGDQGTTHTIGTNSNWETVLAGACSDLTYDVN